MNARRVLIQRRKRIGICSHYAARVSVVLIVCSSTLNGDKTPNSFPRPRWEVRQESGSLGLDEGSWLRVAFATGEVREGDPPLLVKVSPDQVTRVRFNARAEKDSDLLERMNRSGCSYARSMVPKPQSQQQALIIALESPGAFSKLTEKITRRNSMRLVWNEDATERFVVLRVDRCEYAAFLANLRRFLGTRWQSVAEPE